MGVRRPAEVFHPGEHLLDELKARDWTQTEFAEIINRPVRLVNEVINGRRGITPETAKELGAALGTSAEFWMNLDTAYHLWKTDKDVSPITHRARMRSIYPIRDMVLRGWLQTSEDTRVVESQLFRFFEVHSLDEQPRLAVMAAPFRSSAKSPEFSPIQTAWLYRVKHIADTILVPRYSEKKLRNALQQLAAYREAPEEIRNIPKLLAECGVRFVIVEPLPSSKIDGVCLWLNNSPVIGLSLRLDRIDNFWFVLRHEIEHVLNADCNKSVDGEDAVIIDSDFENIEMENVSAEEQKANSAAAEFCVPQKKLDDFIARVSPLFSSRRIEAFAKLIGVHQGLVVGQLQRRLNRYDLLRRTLIPIRKMVIPFALTDGYGHVLPIEV